MLPVTNGHELLLNIAAFSWYSSVNKDTKIITQKTPVDDLITECTNWG